MSKPLRDVGARPVCPEKHPGSRVHIDRTIRRSASGYHQGLGFRCLWDGGRHLIKRPLLPRTMTEAHPSNGRPCPSCGLTHEFGGPMVAADFTYGILEQGKALVRLGRGENYGDVGQGLARSALRPRGNFRLAQIGRGWKPRQTVDPNARTTKTTNYNYREYKEPRSLAGPYSRSATTVTSLLDVFAPPILAAFATDTMPTVLALDSKPLKRRRWVIDDLTGAVSRSSGGERNGEVHVVGDPTATPTTPVLIVLEGGKDAESWLRTFDRLPDGDPPFWVVADLDSGIELAVTTRWPNAILYRCEAHLRKRMKAVLGLDGIPERISAAEAQRLGTKARARSTVRVRRNAIDFAYHPLHKLAAKSLKSPADWDRFKAKVESDIPKNNGETRKWIRANDALIATQFDLKAKHPDMPFSAGGVEATIMRIGKAIEERSEFFSNLGRLDALLGLIRLEAIGVADEVRYSEIIARTLEERAGAGIDWRTPRDVLGMSSIDEHIDFAYRQARVAEAERISARGQTLATRRTADMDARRAEAGLGPTRMGRYTRPDLVDSGPRDSRGRIYYPIVKGQTVADVAIIGAQWRPEHNGGLRAEEVLSGSGKIGVWECNAHEADGHFHVWPRKIIDRVTSRSACPMCAGKLPCATTDLQARFPDLIEEWSPTNGDLTPDMFLPGSMQMIDWKCLKEKWHSIFSQRISARALQHQICPQCFQEKRWGRTKQRRNAQGIVDRQIAAAARVATRPPVGTPESEEELAAEEPTFSPDEVGAALGVTQTTIMNWIRSGRIQARKGGTARKPTYRISAAQVERALPYARVAVPVPTEEPEPVGAIRNLDAEEPGDEGDSLITWFVPPEERGIA